MRLDLLISEMGLAKSRQRAKELIVGGQVKVNGVNVSKPSFDANETDDIKIIGEQLAYVGRGGLKLEKAVKEFGIGLKDRICADIGASTGGFTDCMLKCGAAFVYAVDVGHGQLDDSLKSDPRVKNMEGTNILEIDRFPEEVSFISADVSFVSLKKILPKISGILAENGEAVILIKPQFEAGRSDVGKGGIVKDRKVHKRVLEEITKFALSVGLPTEKMTFSPICGGDGNIEYLAYLKKGGVQAAIDCGEIVSAAFNAMK